jgi:hypothetical protein
MGEVHRDIEPLNYLDLEEVRSPIKSIYGHLGAFYLSWLRGRKHFGMTGPFLITLVQTQGLD